MLHQNLKTQNIGTVQELIENIKNKSIFRLWTIQTWEAWEKFQKRGVLRADGREVWPEFRLAYYWMIEQIKKRLPNYTGHYPLWAWYYPKPDLRGASYLPKGSRGVRIEFYAPRSRLLFSDFGAWHFILNLDYLGLSEEEDKIWEARVPKIKWQNLLELYQKLPVNLRKELEASWERIFDLETLNTSKWAGPVQTIQAVLEEVRMEEVVGVKEFKAR